MSQSDALASPPQWVDLTAFQQNILLCLAELQYGGAQVSGKHPEPHGLAIKEELEALYDQPVNHGRLYPNLDTLVEDGLLEKGEINKRTNYYHLTGDAVVLIDGVASVMQSIQASLDDAGATAQEVSGDD